MVDVSLENQIDNALQHYYAKMGRTDYVNDSGEGLFKQFVVDNGLEDEDIRCELDENATDCILIEFDVDFPLDSDIQGDKRLQAIQHILKHIAGHGEVPSKTKKGKLQINLYISEETAQEIANYRSIYIFQRKQHKKSQILSTRNSSLV
eukprot:148561_1